jgi:hypothetical protein
MAGAGTAAVDAILGIVHRRIAPPLGGIGAPLDARVDWLVDEARRQAADVRATAQGEWLHLACTTCLSKMLTGWRFHADDLLERIGATALLQAYECTGWGYALRFAHTRTRAPRLLLSIVDADVHDAIATGFEDAIGRIGYGVTTVGIALDPAAAPPRCGGPFQNKAFNDLLHAIRALHRTEGRALTFMPFLVDGLMAVAARLIGADMLAPNHYARYGHAFGADPWVGLAEWQLATRPTAPETVTLGAFAYDGYFTACNFRVAPQALMRVDDAPARAADEVAA